MTPKVLACSLLLLSACIGQPFQAGEASPPELDASVAPFADAPADASPPFDVKAVTASSFDSSTPEGASAEAMAPSAPGAADAGEEASPWDASSAPSLIPDAADEVSVLPVCNVGACPCLYEGAIRCCVAAGGVTCL